MSGQKLSCPSAQPDLEDAQLLGLVERKGSAKQVAYLNSHQAVTEKILELALPAEPTEIFRFAATCQEARCSHFDGADCQLAARIVAELAPVTEVLPPCVLRKSCRWHRQEGAAACHRCPQIATRIDPDDHQGQKIGAPSKAAD